MSSYRLVRSQSRRPRSVVEFLAQAQIILLGFVRQIEPQIAAPNSYIKPAPGINGSFRLTSTSEC